ncbi:uncharacterized protein METZ01_LOCUS55478 [marine metagenome]|uniref:Uncharacterized protein n=1 Tax=marine metagenome TaxID=408172 RepID=A0A381SGN4_9ZZZZ
MVEMWPIKRKAVNGPSHIPTQPFGVGNSYI